MNPIATLSARASLLACACGFAVLVAMPAARAADTDAVTQQRLLNADAQLALRGFLARQLPPHVLLN